ncbi:hypothetical protein ACXZ65_31100 [Streptomyces aculeolatus]
MTPLRRRLKRDDGSMSLFYAVTIVGIFLLMGLVVDGGGRLKAGSRATMVATEAARTAGQQVDPGQAIPGSAIVADPAAASAAARSYIAEAGMTGSVRVSGDGKTLTVEVHDTYQPHFASLLGYGSMPVTGRATATLHTSPEG